MPCEFVIGKPRSGKTSYVVAKTLNEDLNYLNDRYKAFVKYVNFYNKTQNIPLSLPPQRHVVFSNIDIYRQYPNMRSYPINGFEFGTNNKFQKTKRLVHYGVYIFDECQRIWPSKYNFTLPPWVTDAFELRGHIDLNIYLIAQKLTKLHSDIRATVDVFTLIQKSVHTYEINGKKFKTTKLLGYGKLLKTVFHGIHFSEESQVLKYLNENINQGENFTYTFEGAIDNHYNPYSFEKDVSDSDDDYTYDDYVVPNKRPEAWDSYRKAFKKQEEKVENAS